MIRKDRLIIATDEVDYLRAQIGTGDNYRIKITLQRLCKAYRSGMVIRPDQLRGIVISILGTAFQPNIDEKVRRWILNGLAQIGDEISCTPAILHILKNYQEEPQTVAAGIAAIYRLSRRKSPDEILDSLDFNPQMRTLAALQHTPASKLDRRGLPINIEGASPDILRLALLVVGLEKSPENLLNPRHTDAMMVEVLGKHHNPIVAQYSVWAITESKKLGVRNLGINIQDTENQPANVRAWILQLLAMEANGKETYWEIVRNGMTDPSEEARRGLALGLRNTFVDVFEPMILDWLSKEIDIEVRQHLLEHLVGQADKSSAYSRFAEEIYESEPEGSPLRQSMKASASGTSLYVKFRMLDAGANNDLFGTRSMMLVDKSIKIENLQASAVNFGSGTTSTYGDTTNLGFNQHQVNEAESTLAELEVAAFNENLAEDERARLLALITEAKKKPSGRTLGDVAEFVGHLGTLAGGATSLSPYALALMKIIGLS